MLLLLQGLLEVLLFLLALLVLEMDFNKAVVLRLDFLLQLVDDMAHDAELSTQLRDLVLRLDEVLRVQVPICSHLLVQLLLLPKSVFCVLNTLLEVLDGEFAHLEFLLELRILLLSLRLSAAVLLALLFQLENKLALLLGLLAETVQLLLEINDRISLLFELIFLEIRLDLRDVGAVLLLLNLLNQVVLVLALLLVVLVQLCNLLFVCLDVLLQLTALLVELLALDL